MQQNRQEVDFSQASDYFCEECGGDRFVVQYIIKSFSALISPTGQAALTPVQCFSCSKCGHINKDFLPGGEGLD